MIKSLLLIFSPARAWDSIVEDRRSVLFILLLFLIPLLAICGAAEGYGLIHWGKHKSGIEVPRTYTQDQVILYCSVQFVLSIFVVFISAKLIQYLGETFHGHEDFTHAFRLVAYALAPLFFCRILDGLPFIPWWVAYGVGMALCVSTMYHGVPRVMDPDPPQAFGLYVTSAFLLTIVSALGRFITAWWLEGKLNQTTFSLPAALGPN